MSTMSYRKEYLLWFLVFGIPIIFGLLPLDMAPKMQYFLAIALWGVLAWMTSIVPAGVVGAVLPSLFFFSGAAPAEVAYAPWFNSLIWGTISILLIGYATDKTGIAKRMAYSIILRFDCNLKGLVWAFMGAGVVMAFIIIDPMARAMIFTTIALGIVRALDIPLKSRESTALGLAAFFAMSGPGLMLYTSGNGIYINSVYRNVAGNIDYFQWMLGNILPSLAWMLISVLIVLKFFRLDNGRCLDARESLLAHKKALGPMSRQEWTTLIVLLVLVADYILAPMADLDPFLLSALPMALLFLPSVGILKPNDFEEANLKILFVMTGAMSIGSVAGAVGLVDVLIKSSEPVMGQGPIIMTIATFVLAVVANFALTPLAIVFTLTEAITNMALAFGYNPLPIAYALCFGTDVYIFPYEYAILLMCTGFGLMDNKLLIKALCLRTLGAFGILFLVSIPYWYLIGLFA